MKRDYSTSSKPIEGITFFRGVEIEHTPAFGKETLFVVGMQDPEEVIELAMKNNVEHVYLGANQSFDLSDNDEILKQQEEGWDVITAAPPDSYVEKLNQLWPKTPMVL